MRLSIIVPSLSGEVPQSLRKQAEGRDGVDVVVVRGVSPIGKARNAGLDRAIGDYIAWVDADDEVADGWLDEILRAIESGPDAIVVGHKWMMDEKFGLEKVWRGGDLMEAVLSQRLIGSELWKFVLRRELWKGVRFDDSARLLEDWEVVPRLLAGATKVVVIGKPLYLYHANSASLTHRIDVDYHRETFRRVIARVDEIKRLGLWRKYGGATLLGVGDTVYGSAEVMSLPTDGRWGPDAQHLVEEERRWLMRRLPVLLVRPARLTQKVKWILGALGLWRVIRWYYVGVQGRKL